MGNIKDRPYNGFRIREYIEEMRSDITEVAQKTIEETIQTLQSIGNMSNRTSNHISPLVKIDVNSKINHAITGTQSELKYELKKINDFCDYLKTQTHEEIIWLNKEHSQVRKSIKETPRINQKRVEKTRPYDHGVHDFFKDIKTTEYEEIGKANEQGNRPIMYGQQRRGYVDKTDKIIIPTQYRSLKIEKHIIIANTGGLGSNNIDIYTQSGEPITKSIHNYKKKSDNEYCLGLYGKEITLGKVGETVEVKALDGSVIKISIKNNADDR